VPWQNQIQPDAFLEGKVNSLVVSDVTFAACDGHVFRMNGSIGSIEHSADLTSIPDDPPGDAPLEVRLVYCRSDTGREFIIAGFQGYVVALDAGTLTRLWTKSLPDVGYALVSVATTGDMVYAATVGYVFRLHWEDGDIRWTNGLDDRGYGNCELLALPSVVIAGIDGHAVGMDPVTLDTAWDLSLPKCGHRLVTLTEDGGTVFAGSAGYIYALSPSGTLQDESPLEDTHGRATSIAAANGYVATGSAGKIFVYKFVSGALVRQWKLFMPEDITSDVDVLFAGGLVYASKMGRVYGFHPDSGRMVRREELPGLGEFYVTLTDFGGEVLMGTHGYLACGPLSLNVEIMAQQQTNWCWIASAVTVADYYGDNSSQCALANQLLGQTVCCIAGNSPQCNKPGDPAQSLTALGHLAASSWSSMPYDDVVSEMRPGHPIVLGIKWSTGGGHAIVLAGVHPNGLIEIKNPWHGATQTVTYDALKNRFEGKGTWNYSYTTK